jgi:hypothetical protein
MTDTEKNFQERFNQAYNFDGDTPTATGTPAGVPHVIVPPDPPEFGPAAARALLRLLLAVHHKRRETDKHSGEES